jgi:Tfp pilus assembly protein PilX
MVVKNKTESANDLRRNTALDSRLRGNDDSRPNRRSVVTQRRGVTLLLCLFVIGVTSVLLLGILETAMLEMTAARNTADYERAVYLAGAGIHHALAELEQDPNWTGPIPPTEFPAGSGNTYEVTTSPGSGNTIIVTSTGTAGTVTRTLEATVQLGE